MEALYSKLYNKYTTLKTAKDSELEELNRDQEVKFMNYVAAADELIDHLRTENDRLRAQVNDLRSEIASVRASKDQEHAKYQKLLMEENQKSKELSEEVERLRNLQEGFSHSARDERTENGLVISSGGSQVGSERSRRSSVRMIRKRSRLSRTETADLDTHIARNKPDDALARGSGNENFKGTMVVVNSPNVWQPECCRRKTYNSGGDLNVTGPTNCIFQDLIECLIGMKLSTMNQADEICVSALHQSSGYSFNLTWVKNSFGDVELLYRVLSLGTFERVAPEWMRDVLMFSTTMCPIFFERISGVLKLHK